MRIDSLVTFFLAGLVSSGPARRDCGQEKCYDAVNECGMTYGGCWTECADGVTEVPTFTAPLCFSDTNTALAMDSGYSVPTSGTVSPTNVNTNKPLITSPPNPSPTKAPSSGKSRTCSPLWLCVDHQAVCGDLTQMYGGCYDVCTSAPPVTSPPCSLSSNTIESGYATATPTPEPGVAYTNNPPVDSVAPAIDDSKALVMAEMPNVDAAFSTPEPSAAPAPDGGESRFANVQANQPAPIAEASELIEAPQSLRGAAIAKMMADKVRKPNTANVACWDSPDCKEVQLGIPSPLPSAAESSEAAAAPTAEPAPEPEAEPSADTPADVPVEASA